MRLGAPSGDAHWDHEFDVVVVGSGAGGLTAAIAAHDLGQSVAVLEKSDQYGGTSAISGGGVWVPCNHLLVAAGANDSHDDALTYLKAATRGMVSEARLLAYLEHAPRMVRYLEEKTCLRYRAMPNYSDYYPALPGSKPGYRTMDPLPFNAARLGDEFARMRPPQPGTLIAGRVTMTAGEAHVILCKERGWTTLFTRRMARYWLDLPWRFRSKRDRRLTLGSSLVGSLRRSMIDRNIPLWLNTALESLVTDARRVVGLVATQNGATVRIAARRGVILAAGGFEHNQAMRDEYLPKPTRAEWTVTPPSNTGDAIRAGQGVGAQVALMDHAWWAPTVFVMGREKRRALFVERNLPGCVMVNRLGNRFVDEAAPYGEVVYAMYADQPEEQRQHACVARLRRRIPPQISMRTAAARHGASRQITAGGVDWYSLFQGRNSRRSCRPNRGRCERLTRDCRADESVRRERRRQGIWKGQQQFRSLLRRRQRQAESVPRADR